MLQLVSTLHSLQVSLAVISDPCFGPGMRWPRWTGYDFFGQRTTKNNTVAVLVAIEILHYVEFIPDVGDPRALWVKVHTSESDGPEFLLLAMYAPPSNYMPKERLDFFASRVTELCSLRSLPKFASLPLLLAGDLNIHMHEICEKMRNLNGRSIETLLCFYVVVQALTWPSGTQLMLLRMIPGLPSIWFFPLQISNLRFRFCRGNFVL